MNAPNRATFCKCGDLFSRHMELPPHACTRYSCGCGAWDGGERINIDPASRFIEESTPALSVLDQAVIDAAASLVSTDGYNGWKELRAAVDARAAALTPVPVERSWTIRTIERTIGADEYYVNHTGTATFLGNTEGTPTYPWTAHVVVSVEPQP